MKVLVDTSVWSPWLRRDLRRPTPEMERLERCLQGNTDIYLTPLIVQEILQGIRPEAVFLKTADFLESFPLLLVEREQAVFAAKISRQCASKGITSSSVDCQIAATAIAYDCRLLSADQDFERIAQHTDLQLVDLGASP